ncbi:MAG: sulfotransferase domain-containing protein [Actinomycetota bacterium]|nr:sulfotransferase domain-containing protein [Actinomycetota bacterium]
MSGATAGLRRIGRRAPSAAAPVVRAAVLRWGMLTSRWRATPGVLVVGAQRCGTTTLFRLLSGHPALARPTLSKGIGYFDLHYDRGPAWYAGHFPIRRDGKTAFENSGYYLFHPLAPERIAGDLPEVRVIAMVRDPVERAYSAHAHETRRGFESEPFAVAVDLEEARLAGEVSRMRSDPGYQSFEHRHHGYLGRGRYAEQLQPYLDLLGPDRVLVLDPWLTSDSFRTEWIRALDWLGQSRWVPDEIGAWNQAPRTPMADHLRARLSAYFEPHDAALAPILGRTPSWRS